MGVASCQGEQTVTLHPLTSVLKNNNKKNAKCLQESGENPNTIGR